MYHMIKYIYIFNTQSYNCVITIYNGPCAVMSYICSMEVIALLSNLCYVSTDYKSQTCVT